MIQKMGRLALCTILICLVEEIAGVGFGGCECNFAGGCNADGVHSGLSFSELTPTGIDQFAMKDRGITNLVNLCEKGTVAILYDCNARIPLYAATMMTGAQIDTRFYKREGEFSNSYDHNLSPKFQAQHNDYIKSSERNICYETPDGKYDINVDWLPKVGKKRVRAEDSNEDCIKSPIHKGHLIAASYGRGKPERVIATFTYTNSVPQFGSFNSGQWCKSENYLRSWALKYCSSGTNKNTRLFIVTGAVPSTFDPRKKAMFFGKAGFSNFQGPSNLDKTYSSKTIPGGRGSLYRVNVPTHLWTVACCTFDTGDGSKIQTRSTAFYGKNNPNNEPCTNLNQAGHLGDFFKDVLGMAQLQDIDLFPSEPSCDDSANFIKLI